MLVTRLFCEVPAKINLTLAITGRRPDGYHELCSVFQETELRDRLLLDLIPVDASLALPQNVPDEPELRFALYQALTDLRIPGFPTLEQEPANTVRLATCTFLEELFHRGERRALLRYKLSFTLEKHIPSQAGLGGGSADAAGALLLLNEAWDQPFTRGELLELGARVGMDVPFCIQGGTALVRGTGAVLEALPGGPRLPLLLVQPPTGVSTAAAYRAWDEKHLNEKGELLEESREAEAKALRFVSLWREGRYEEAWPLVENSFVAPFVEAVREGRELLEALARTEGCLASTLSGSGSVCWALYKTEEELAAAALALRSRYPGWYVQETHMAGRA